MLLCFDNDGVISDSIYQLTEVARKAQRIVGKGRPPTVYDFKTNDPMTIENFARKIGMPEENVRDFFDTYFNILVSRKEKPKPFPGIIDVLKKLSKENIIVIITASVKLEVTQILQAYDAHHVVSLILDANEPGDKSEKILKAIDVFKVEKSDTVMIGDTTSDIKYGKAAGVKTIAVTWGYHSKELLIKENPDFFAYRPEDLLKIVNNLKLSQPQSTQ